MYHVPYNRVDVEYPLQYVLLRNLWFCFIGLWIFNIPYRLFFEADVAILEFIFRKWKYFAPIFFVQSVINCLMLKYVYSKLKLIHTYLGLICLGFFSSLIWIAIAQDLNRTYNLSKITVATTLENSYSLSLIIGLISGSFAVGGLVSMQQRTFPQFEWYGVCGFAGLGLLTHYVLEKFAWVIHV